MNAGRKSELAIALAGTSDKKSRAYKSARRQVERTYPSDRLQALGRKPQRPRPAMRERLEAARVTVSTRLSGAFVRVKVSWYALRKSEWLPPHKWIMFSAAEWARAEFDEGERFALFLEKYNVANPLDWLHDVQVLEWEIEPREELV